MSGYEVKILFGTLIFYTFLAFILGIGAYTWLTSDIPALASFQPALVKQSGQPLWDWLTGAWTNLSNFITVIGIILFNPFSSLGFISWFSISLMIINLYTIARLIRGGG